MIYAPISAVGVLMVFSASYFTAAGLLVCVPMDEHRDFINDTRFDYYKEDYAIITVKRLTENSQFSKTLSLRVFLRKLRVFLKKLRLFLR